MIVRQHLLQEFMQVLPQLKWQVLDQLNKEFSCLALRYCEADRSYDGGATYSNFLEDWNRELHNQLEYVVTKYAWQHAINWDATWYPALEGQMVRLLEKSILRHIPYEFNIKLWVGLGYAGFWSSHYDCQWNKHTTDIKWEATSLECHLDHEEYGRYLECHLDLYKEEL